MRAPIIESEHAVAMRTPGDCVDAVVAPTFRGLVDALTRARFDALHGSVEQLADEMEREFRPSYAKRGCDS